MSYNKELHKKNISEITEELFKEAIFLCYKGGITSRAPLGFSGDDILLLGKAEGGRKGLVSIRNYCGDAEMLITDMDGKFLFYGRYDIDLGVDFVVSQYWQMFNLIKDKINTVVEQKSKFKNLSEAEHCTYSEGFNLLRSYQLNLVNGLI